MKLNNNGGNDESKCEGEKKRQEDCAVRVSEVKRANWRQRV